MATRGSRLRGFAWAIAFGMLLLVGAGILFPQAALEAEFARLRFNADAVERVIEVDGERIVYLEAGSGPILVLLHGFTGSKENWLPLMPHLTARWRVIAPDLPGWGESQRVEGADYGYAAQAERVAKLLSLLDDEPVALVGHSMGGGIAAVLAARRPALLSKLVLMDAAGALFRENAFGRAVQRGENPFAVSDRESLDRQLALVFDAPPFVPWPADRALIAHRIADAQFENDVLDRIGRGPDAFLPSREAARITTPTKLVWCREDRVIDRSAADVYLGLIQGSTLTLLDGCAHMPMMEQPEATTIALEEFLQ